jgi:hypothetical protein
VASFVVADEFELAPGERRGCIHVKTPVSWITINNTICVGQWQGAGGENRTFPDLGTKFYFLAQKRVVVPELVLVFRVMVAFTRSERG